jgi:hypothetical protein
MTTIFSLERVRRKPGIFPETMEERLMTALRDLLPADAYAIRGGEGVPDIIVCHRGRALGLELKARTESFSEAQTVNFPRLRDAGMRIEVARDPDQALNLLREMGVRLKEEPRHAVRDVVREETRRRK